MSDPGLPDLPPPDEGSPEPTLARSLTIRTVHRSRRPRHRDDLTARQAVRAIAYMVAAG
jgi:hypothetical protein